MTKLIAALAAAVALSTPASYLQSQQQPDGGWGSPQMTSWVALGLRAAGADTGGALGYLVAHEAEATKPTEIALVALAEAALGHDPQSLVARFTARPTAVNTAIWQILALRQSGRAVPRTMSGVPACIAGAQRRLRVDARHRSRLERHRRGGAGTAGRRCAREADRACARLLAHASGSERRLQALRRTRSGRSVDGVRDPGVRCGRRETAEQSVFVPREASAIGRQLSVFPLLRDDAGLGHRAGAAGARQEAVSSALASRTYSTRRIRGSKPRR